MGETVGLFNSSADPDEIQKLKIMWLCIQVASSILPINQYHVPDPNPEGGKRVLERGRKALPNAPGWGKKCPGTQLIRSFWSYNHPGGWGRTVGCWRGTKHLPHTGVTRIKWHQHIWHMVSTQKTLPVVKGENALPTKCYANIYIVYIFKASSWLHPDLEARNLNLFATCQVVLISCTITLNSTLFQ